jgi:hypothetical protein
MLSYLLLLSVWTAKGINNSLRGASLEGMAPESFSDSLTPKGIEDDSSHTILTQTQGYQFLYPPLPYAEGYEFIHFDRKYLANKDWVTKDARPNYALCGFVTTVGRYSIYSRYRFFLHSLKATYCKKGDWYDQYSELFGSSDDPPNAGTIITYSICPEKTFIYGFWGASDDAEKYPMNDFGYYCSNNAERHPLKFDDWSFSNHNDFNYYRSTYSTDRICGFGAQVSSSYNAPADAVLGIEGFKVKFC